MEVLGSVPVELHPPPSGWQALQQFSQQRNVKVFPRKRQPATSMISPWNNNDPVELSEEASP